MTTQPAVWRVLQQQSLPLATQTRLADTILTALVVRQTAAQDAGEVWHYDTITLLKLLPTAMPPQLVVLQHYPAIIVALTLQQSQNVLEGIEEEEEDGSVFNP